MPDSKPVIPQRLRWGGLQNPGHSRTNVSDKLWQRTFGTPQKSDNRLVMSRRLGGVPKARGHIQSGKSYKTAVLQHLHPRSRAENRLNLKFCSTPFIRNGDSAFCNSATNRGIFSLSYMLRKTDIIASTATYFCC